MATLFRTNGIQEEVLPTTGRAFTLAELQTLVGGYIEIVYTHDGKVMVVDEEGKLKGKALNYVATTHYRFGRHDPLVGEVLVGTIVEMSGAADEDDRDDTDEDDG